MSSRCPRLEALSWPQDSARPASSASGAAWTFRQVCDTCLRGDGGEFYPHHVNPCHLCLSRLRLEGSKQANELRPVPVPFPARAMSRGSRDMSRTLSRARDDHRFALLPPSEARP